MRSRALPVTLLLLAALIAAAPAHASVRYAKDPGGGEGSGLDIRAVQVSNTAKGVSVLFSFPPIDGDVWPSGFANVYLDTNHRSAGPELIDTISIPGDGGIRATKGSAAWKRSWNNYSNVGTCGRTVVNRFNAEAGRYLVLIKPKRGCLYHPTYFRAHVRTVAEGTFDYAGGGYESFDEPIYDFFPRWQRYSTWNRYTTR